ncbi:MAG TPA: cytochrome c-type biogenesis CcmF C-terminal domain-containing protein [Gemmatimonadaceae bacterium]|nr:cytochrome c-type biogenesis CcmF C-terminal domain-containing protein [Gemmatimonadaceae bacterium]
MILVGELALWIALLMAAWGAIVSFAGASADHAALVVSGERALVATFAGVVLATAGLLVALVTSDFSLAYVASFTAANLPIGYKIAALWADRAGALLVWTLCLSTCATIAVATNRTGDRSLMPYVAGLLSIALLVFLVLLCFYASPYQRIAPIPPEGRGMAPELQHLAMVIHPPSLSLGYAATVTPMAFALAALVTRRVDADWAYPLQRWLAIAWLFLTLGIVTGMWWEYADPGRHERWAWNPVRSGAVVPWLGVAILGALAGRYPRLRLTPRADESAVVRKRRRGGVAIAIGGAAVVVLALVGIPFSRRHTGSLGSGESATLVDPFRRTWTFTSQGVSDFPERNRAVEAIALRVTRDGASHGLISSERRQYVDSRGAAIFGPSLEAGIDHSLLQDTYVVLTNVVDDRAEVRIAFHPFRVWVWIGGIAIAIGGSMAMWPPAAIRAERA